MFNIIYWYTETWDASNWSPLTCVTLVWCS